MREILGGVGGLLAGVVLVLCYIHGHRYLESNRSTYYEEPTQHYPESNLLCQSMLDGKVYTGYCWRI